MPVLCSTGGDTGMSTCPWHAISLNPRIPRKLHVWHPHVQEAGVAARRDEIENRALHADRLQLGQLGQNLRLDRVVTKVIDADVRAGPEAVRPGVANEIILIDAIAADTDRADQHAIFVKRKTAGKDRDPIADPRAGGVLD